MPAREFPNLGLMGGFDPHENGWDDEMNLNLLKMSVLTQGTVIDKVAAEPGVVTAGAVYLLDETNATNPNAIAVYDGPTGEEAWVYFIPEDGWLLFNQAEGYYEKFDGTIWAELETGGGGEGGGISDAPADGSTYGRKNNEWSEIISDTDLSVPYGSHRYWRIRSSASVSGAYLVVSELAFTDKRASVLPTTGGSPIGTPGDSGREPSMAFDRDPSTSYASTPTYSENGGFLMLGYDFGVPVEVGGFYLMAGLGNSANAPKTWDVQYSDDNAAWFTAWSVTNFVFWPASQVFRSPDIVFSDGAPVPFRGCRASRSANLAVGSSAAIPWTTETYDLGGWHDNAVNNTRFTVPAGVKRVRISGQFEVQSPSGGQSFRVTKNGGSSQVATAQVGNSAYSFTVMNFDTGVIDCVPGDYFEVIAEGNSTLIPGRTFVAIEAVSDKVSRADLSPTLNAQAGAAYSLVAADDGNIVEMTSGASNVVTIPANATTGIAVGSTFSVVQIGAGATTIQAAAGVTLNGVAEGEAVISGQWGGVSLYKRATDEWVIQGAHGGVS